MKHNDNFNSSSSDYRELCRDQAYVDNTGLIREFIDSPDSYLIKRPDGYGKTTNISMFRTFFEKSDEDTSVYFKDFEIWKAGEKYRKEQGRYPVLYMSFKDIGGDSWEDMKSNFVRLMTELFSEHEECRSLDPCLWDLMLSGNCHYSLIPMKLQDLCRCLSRFHGEKTVVLVDDADAPLLNALLGGFYDGAHSFVLCMLSALFKSNESLKYGWIASRTSIKDGVLSGKLNNILDSSLENGRFDKWFSRYGEAPGKRLSSILEGADADSPDTWIVREILKAMGPRMENELRTLIAGGTVNAFLPSCIQYGDMYEGRSHAMGLLADLGCIVPRRMMEGTIFGDLYELSLNV